MTKIDIFSGFLGAGKTTLIKKLIKEGYENEKIVLIENEFGEIGIDGGFLKEAGIQINEMNSGCICCSLVGDFREALNKVIEQYHPDRILIEPSGVGKLSDVINAVKSVTNDNVILNSFITVADASKVKSYMKNFGEFYNNQIEYTNTIILSRTQNVSDEKLSKSLELIREHNKTASVVTTPWDKLTGKQILSAADNNDLLTVDDVKSEHEHHHHHHHEDGEECHCHDHDHEHEHEHHHHHEDGEECHCHDHEHEHHHHHHADEVFTSWGVETARKYDTDEIKAILEALADSEKYGTVLRAKGIVEGKDGQWIHYDLVPGESEVRNGAADYTGRICVIGSKLKEDALKELFGV